jgi:hypothetical protein
MSVQVIIGKLKKAFKYWPVQPPPCVRGMTAWQPELFSTSVLLPCLRVSQVKGRRAGGTLSIVTLTLAMALSMQTMYPLKHASLRT